MSGESSTSYYYSYMYIFPVSPLSLDFGESSLEYPRLVSPLHKYILSSVSPLREYYVSGESSVT
jgi:hypothetical protein